jgi:antitoxin component of MazEF toxin-antitoxin module
MVEASKVRRRNMVMEMRKVLRFNTVLGLTLPKQFTNVMGISSGEYLEVFLANDETIVIKKHRENVNKLNESEINKINKITQHHGNEKASI